MVKLKLKLKFLYSKYPININNLDINNIIIPNNLSFAKNSKHFIGYNVTILITMPLCILITKISGYTKKF